MMINLDPLVSKAQKETEFNYHGVHLKYNVLML